MERSDQKRSSPGTSAQGYAAKLAWHKRQAQLPLWEKVRILLELQRQDLPLLRRHRPLKRWERPWEIEP